MRTEPPSSGECALCGRALPAEPFYGEGGLAFCSAGCRRVHFTLGGAADEGSDVPGRTGEGHDASDETGDADDSSDPTGAPADARGAAAEASDEAPAPTDGAPTRTYLRVDGMHGVTCEAYLESIAESKAGVTDAEASYVTETIRVDHDPDEVSESELCDALSRTGYTASPREDATDASGAHAGHGRGSARGLNDVLGFRYAAGVVFGSFMLLPYVVLLYPAQLASFLDTAGLWSGGAWSSGEGSVMALRMFLVLTGVVLFFTGLPLLRGAYVSLKTRRPNTDLLVAITVVAAYVYSTVAFLLGRIDVFYDTTIVVTAAVVAAMFYESVAKRRAVDRLTDLTVSQVSEAERYDDGTTTEVPVEDLAPGDRVLVRQGERVPVDGVVAEGSCTVNEAVVTGESLPVVKRAGDAVIGGSVVADDAAVLRVGDAATSSIDRLTTAVWDIQSADHGVQRRADRLAGVVIPVVAGAALVVGSVGFVLGGGIVAGVLGFLTVLVVGCPWALGLSTPLSVATSIEEAMEAGIVVFDETVFERLLSVDVVVFDKTGTLTTGAMDVVSADAPDDLLAAAAALERRASHPAAAAIAAAFGGGDGEGSGVRTDGGVVGGGDGEDGVGEEGDEADEAGDEGDGMDDVGDDGDDADPVDDFRSYPNGVGGTVAGREVLVGHPDLFAERGWSVGDELEARAADAREFGRIPVLVGRDGAAEGLVVVGDEPREGWDEVLTRLGERGVDVVVLTGDDEEATEFFGRHPHVDHVFAGVPPEGKTATIRRLQAGGAVSMVGDGTNDAPALAQADLGISLGGGTAIASDAADLAIVDDDLACVETAFDLAGAARSRLKQNSALALLYNAITIPLAAVGLLNPLFVMVAVVLTGGLIAANSFRGLLGE